MVSLKLTDVSYAYPARPAAPVLAGVSAELPLDGHSLVLGPNGAGKTALCRLVAGLDRPTAGRVDWPDERIDHPKVSWEPLRCGVVFEQPGFQFQGFSVAEELTGGLLYRGASRAEADGLARETSAELGLDGLLDTAVDSLDCGLQLAVLVTAFLLLRPRLLVLDFSLADLEADFRGRLLEWCVGSGTPSLLAASRRAEDIAILPDAPVFALAGGGLDRIYIDPADRNAVARLAGLGIALPWYADFAAGEAAAGRLEAALFSDESAFAAALRSG